MDEPQTAMRIPTAGIWLTPWSMDRGLRALVLLLICIVAWLNAAPAHAQSEDFDHFRTRFPLVGAHARVGCDSCHRDGLFRGTPVECRFCHDGTGQRATTAPSSRHIPHSGLACASCHRATRWEPARMDHSVVTAQCASCHNDVVAEGKHGRHVPSSQDCGSCHRTSTWQHARFDHGHITGACRSCHDGVTATGMHAGHLVTGSDCDLCHSSRRWSPSRFDHSAASGSCSSCHNDVTATGKPGGHPSTTAECDVCHSNRRWVPTDFDHSVVSSNCGSCHNDVDATGPPSNHFTSSLECNECHSTNRWTGADYDHAGGGYPGDHRRSLNCTRCHGGNSETVTWSNSAYQPDCAGCHSSDYRSGPHKKHENPDRNYTVSELRDCSGSCHVYRDSSMTTIKDQRNREHRVSDGDFD